MPPWRDCLKVCLHSYWECTSLSSSPKEVYLHPLSWFSPISKMLESGYKACCDITGLHVGTRCAEVMTVIMVVRLSLCIPLPQLHKSFSRCSKYMCFTSAWELRKWLVLERVLCHSVMDGERNCSTLVSVLVAAPKLHISLWWEHSLQSLTLSMFVFCLKL